MNINKKLKLFHCEKLKATISEKQCVINQTKIHNNKLFASTKYEINNPCIDCEEGRKRLPQELKEKIETKEFKICKAWKENPELCHGNKKNGKFYRKIDDDQARWNRKLYCSIKCQLSFANTKKRRTEFYNKYDFCKDIKCINFKNNKCVVDSDNFCIHSVKIFYKWLINNNYIIQREKNENTKK